MEIKKHSRKTGRKTYTRWCQRSEAFEKVEIRGITGKVKSMIETKYKISDEIEYWCIFDKDAKPGEIVKVKYMNKHNQRHNSHGPAVIKYDGIRCKEEWYHNGSVHRKSKPAVIRTENGEVIKEEWYCNGSVHRKSKPAVIRTENGEVIKEEWYKHGRHYRRDDKPSIVEYKHGKIIERQWWKNGWLHRIGGPALKSKNVEEWRKDGKYHRRDGPAKIIKGEREGWYFEGKLHRRGGPALRKWHNGQLLCEEWRFLGELHRKDGPAIVNYDIGTEEWWANGRKMGDYNIEKIKKKIRRDVKRVLRILPTPIADEIWHYYSHWH